MQTFMLEQHLFATPAYLLLLLLLLQGHEANQKRLNAANGIDTLLMCLAGFKSKEPADAEELEYMENLFDTLCSSLLLPANRYC